MELENTMDKQHIQWKSIFYGFLSFIMLWVIWSTLVRIASDETNMPNEAVFYAISVLSGLLPGYIASITSRKHYLLHSAFTGIAISAGILLFWSVIGAIAHASLYSLITTPVYLIILSLLGGLIAKLLGKVA